MQLPKIELPTFKLELPVSKKEITLVPWVMSQRKILSLADSSGDRMEQFQAIKQIVNECWLDVDKDVDKLPNTDFEYIFIKLRARSAGSQLVVSLTLADGRQGKTSINLEEVKPLIFPRHEELRKATLSSGTYVVLEDPTVSDIEAVLKAKIRDPRIDELIMLAARCIRQVWIEDEMKDVTDARIEDLEEMLSGLPELSFKEINEFLDTMPRIFLEVQLSQVFAGMQGTHRLEGLHDFLEYS